RMRHACLLPMSRGAEFTRPLHIVQRHLQSEERSLRGYEWMSCMGIDVSAAPPDRRTKSNNLTGGGTSSVKKTIVFAHRH
ncbi:MAG: hypothetical protein WCO51_07580, partial [bacterium]